MQYSPESSITIQVQNDSGSPCTNCGLFAANEDSHAASDNGSNIAAANRHTESLVSLSRRRPSATPLPLAPNIPVKGIVPLRERESQRRPMAIGSNSMPQETFVSLSALTASGTQMPAVCSSMGWATPRSSSSRRRRSHKAVMGKRCTILNVKVHEDNKVEEDSGAVARGNSGGDEDASAVPRVGLSSSAAVQRQEDEKIQTKQKELKNDEERLVKGGGCSNFFCGFQRLFRSRKSKKKQEKDGAQPIPHTSVESAQKHEDQNQQQACGLAGGPSLSADTGMNAGKTSPACMESAKSPSGLGCDGVVKSTSVSSFLAPPTSTDTWTKAPGHMWAKDEVRRASLDENDDDEGSHIEGEELYTQREESGEAMEGLDHERDHHSVYDNLKKEEGEEEAGEEKKEKEEVVEEEEVEQEGHDEVAYDSFLSSRMLQKMHEKDISDHESYEHDRIVPSPPLLRTHIPYSQANRNMDSPSDVSLKFHISEGEKDVSGSVKTQGSRSPSQSNPRLTATARTTTMEDVESEIKNYGEDRAHVHAAYKRSGHGVDVPTAYLSPPGTHTVTNFTRHKKGLVESPIVPARRTPNRAVLATERALWRTPSQTEKSRRCGSVGCSVSPPPRTPIPTTNKLGYADLINVKKTLKRQRVLPQSCPQHQQQKQSSRRCSNKKQNVSASPQRRGEEARHSGPRRLDYIGQTPKQRMTSFVPENVSSNLVRTQSQSPQRMTKKNPQVRYQSCSPIATRIDDSGAATTSGIGRCCGNSYAQLAAKRRDYEMQGGDMDLQGTGKRFTKSVQRLKGSPVRIAGLHRVSHSRSPYDGLTWRGFKAQFYSHDGFTLLDPILPSHTCSGQTSRYQLPDTEDEMLALLIAQTRASCVACGSGKRERQLWRGMEDLLNGARRPREEFYDIPPLPQWEPTAAAMGTLSAEALPFSMGAAKGKENISTRVEEEKWAFSDPGVEEKQRSETQPQRSSSYAYDHVDHKEQYIHSNHLENRTGEKTHERKSSEKVQKYEEGQTYSSLNCHSDGNVSDPIRSALPHNAAYEQHHAFESIHDESKTLEIQQHGQDDELHCCDGGVGQNTEVQLPDTPQCRTEDVCHHLHDDAGELIINEDHPHVGTSHMPAAFLKKPQRPTSSHLSAQRNSERVSSAGAMLGPDERMEGKVDEADLTLQRRFPHLLDSSNNKKSDKLPSSSSCFSAAAAVLSAEQRIKKERKAGGYVSLRPSSTRGCGGSRSGRADPSWEEERKRMEDQLITLAEERSMLKDQLGIYTFFEEAKRQPKNSKDTPPGLSSTEQASMLSQTSKPQ